MSEKFSVQKFVENVKRPVSCFKIRGLKLALVVSTLNHILAYVCTSKSVSPKALRHVTNGFPGFILSKGLTH